MRLRSWRRSGRWASPGAGSRRWSSAGRSASPALTALAALPLGLALAWVLPAVVNVHAFGWRLPVLLFPGQWAMLFALALATAALAALWPALRLRRARRRSTLLRGVQQ